MDSSRCRFQLTPERQNVRLGYSITCHIYLLATLTLMLLVVQGKTWPDGVSVWSGPSAYSQLVSLGDDSTIGVLFEAGSKMAYETISFAEVQV